MHLDIAVDTNGDITKEAMSELLSLLSNFPSKTVSINIDMIQSGRSNPLNKYYHTVIIHHQIIAIKDSWGYILDPLDMHLINLNTFFASFVFDADEFTYIKTPTSSTRNTNWTFMQALEHIRQYFFLHFSYSIPLPE